MRSLWILIFAGLASAGALASPQSAEEAAIRTQIQGYLDAWNTGDPDAMASFIDTDGDRVNALGMALKGREAIRDHYRKVFSTPPPRGITRKLIYHAVSIRIVSADAAVVDVSYEVTGVGPIPEMTIHGLNTVFMVKRGGRWLRAAHRNSVPTTPECVRRCAAQP